MIDSVLIYHVFVFIFNNINRIILFVDIQIQIKQLIFNGLEFMSFIVSKKQIFIFTGMFYDYLFKEKV